MQRAVSVVVSIACLCAVVHGQAMNLDRPAGLDTQYLEASTPPFSVALKVGMTADVSVGFEQASSPTAAMDGPRQSLLGLSARQIFDALVTRNPQYQWREMNGVAVVRPATAWADAKDVLNRQVPPAQWTSVTVEQATALMTILVGAGHGVRVLRGVGNTFSVRFDGGTVLELLNTIAADNGHLVWRVAPSARLPGDWLVALQEVGDHVAHRVGVANWHFAQ